MPEIPDISAVRWRVLRGAVRRGDVAGHVAGPIANDGAAAAFLSPPGFCEALSRGEIGYLNRNVWPPQRIIHNRVAIDPLDIRSDYVAAESLLRRLPATAHDDTAHDDTAWIVFRANIPLNLGYGFRQDRVWRHHPEDAPARFDDARVLAIDPTRGTLGATRQLPALQPADHDDRLALLAPCLGAEGRFDPAAYIGGTYDVRHLLDVDNRWPRLAAWPQETYATLRNDPGNQRIARLTALFHHRDLYRQALSEAVDVHGPAPRWARYNRTLCVVSSLDAVDAPRRFALVATSAATPPEAFAVATAVSRVERPVVFELVQGGSFGFGLWHRGQLHDLSQAGREVGYYRGVQGLWFGCLGVTLAETNVRMMGLAAAAPPDVAEIDAGTGTPADGRTGE